MRHTHSQVPQSAHGYLLQTAMSGNVQPRILRRTTHLVFEQFNERLLFLKESDEMKKYERRKSEQKLDMKWGQLKLLTSEMEALLWFWDSAAVPNLKVVYAGAASGNHFSLLSMLFPSIEWYLYDPQPFAIEPTNKIHIFNSLFTDEIAKEWSGRNDVFFFSDIRSVSHKEVSMEDNERGIWRDMQLQERWTLIINPYRASLKMRLPYFNAFNDRHSEYLYGHIMLQPFTAPTSTETRLIPVRDETGSYFRIKYDVKEYEERLFHHNSVTRESVNFRNPSSGCIIRKLNSYFDVTLFIFITDVYLTRTSAHKEKEKTERVNSTLDMVVFIIEELMKSCKGTKAEWTHALLQQMNDELNLEE